MPLSSEFSTRGLTLAVAGILCACGDGGLGRDSVAEVCPVDSAKDESSPPEDVAEEPEAPTCFLQSFVDIIYSYRGPITAARNVEWYAFLTSGELLHQLYRPQDTTSVPCAELTWQVTSCNDIEAQVEINSSCGDAQGQTLQIQPVDAQTLRINGIDYSVSSDGSPEMFAAYCDAFDCSINWSESP